MRSNNLVSRLALAGATLALLVVPAVVLGAPESILPPGFGDPDPPKPRPKPAQPRPGGSDLKLPADLLPEGDEVPRSTAPRSIAVAGGSASLTVPAGDSKKEGEDGEEGDEEVPILVDLPPSARRSLDNVGVLGFDDGDMGADAFGAADGRYLGNLLRAMNAPLVSRWGSIMLRRALLSKVNTPVNINGADWVAERAWLLLKMGEADSARLLVQSVDTDRFTPRLYEIGMQSALANADMASACPMVDGALVDSTEKAWKMTRAICAALAGEAPQASAQIDSLRDRREVKGVDILLAEKVVGAGGNSRRSVKIEWEDVPALTAWRYGLATTTAVPIPDRLFRTVGYRVRAWQAKAPLLSFAERQRAADVAASLGVFSSQALVDHYAAMADGDDVQEAQSAIADKLRIAFAGTTVADRVGAMRSLWTADGLDTRARHARYIMTARAAALLPLTDAATDDVDSLVFSMMTAGYDLQAARWLKIAQSAGGTAGERALAIMAVGLPRGVSGFASGDVSGFDGLTGNGSKMLFAGMAGLGRLSSSDIESLAEDLEVPIGRSSPWTRAMDRAVAAGERGTVAILAAAALQTSDWAKVRPEYLYRAISGLRQVGLEGEARMIAAEAVARS